MRAFLVAAIAVMSIISMSCENGTDAAVNGANSNPVIQSLAATPDSVPSGGSAIIKCIASDPENDPLYYEWETPLASLTGSGEQVVFTFASCCGSEETVKVTVHDGRGGSASKSKTMYVQF